MSWVLYSGSEMTWICIGTWKYLHFCVVGLKSGGVSRKHLVLVRIRFEFTAVRQVYWKQHYRCTMCSYECYGRQRHISVYATSYYATCTYVHTTDNIGTGTYYCECTAAVLVRLARKCLDMLLRKTCSNPFVDRKLQSIWHRIWYEQKQHTPNSSIIPLNTTHVYEC